MDVEILKIMKPRKSYSVCSDFAELKWPKGITDYLYIYPDQYQLIAGYHVDGWTGGVTRKGVEGWIFTPFDTPLLPNIFIFVRIAGAKKRMREKLKNIILAKYRKTIKGAKK